MQMTVMSEGLLVNSKYIKMGREEGRFKLSLRSHPLLLFAMRFNVYPFTALRPWEELRGSSLSTLIDKIHIRHESVAVAVVALR